MKNKTGIIVLILISVAMCVVLIWNQKQVLDLRHSTADTISTLSNHLATTTAKLTEQQQVNDAFESRLQQQNQVLATMTNDLETTAAVLKTAQQQVVQRDARIQDLEAQNQALDQRALELSQSITNLTGQIAETQRKLTAAEGDKEALTKELSRLLADKAELERQFNDLSALRAQVARIKEQMNIARRVEWARKGLTAGNNPKGGEQLMQMSRESYAAAHAPAAPPKPAVHDLNVELDSDGTWRTIPPLTNTPASPGRSP